MNSTVTPQLTHQNPSFFMSRTLCHFYFWFHLFFKDRPFGECNVPVLCTLFVAFAATFEYWHIRFSWLSSIKNLMVNPAEATYISVVSFTMDFSSSVLRHLLPFSIASFLLRSDSSLCISKSNTSCLSFRKKYVVNLNECKNHFRIIKVLWKSSSIIEQQVLIKCLPVSITCVENSCY